MFSLKMKKEDVSYLKIIKIVHMARDTPKTLKRGRKWKTESIRRVSQQSNDNRILYFYFFVYIYILIENIVGKI